MGELAEADETALCARVNRKLSDLYHRPMADWGLTKEQLSKRRTEKEIEQVCCSGPLNCDRIHRPLMPDYSLDESP